MAGICCIPMPCPSRLAEACLETAPWCPRDWHATLACTDYATLGSMDDLQIPAGPGVPRGLTVPAAELVEQFSHASGPGGQGVNTTDSKVQLSLDLGTTTALSQAQRQRALARLGPRLAGPVPTSTAGGHRPQHRNRKAARQRPDRKSAAQGERQGR